MHGFRLIGDSELTIGVNASVGGLTVFVLTLQQVSGLSWVCVLSLLPYDSLDCLHPIYDPELDNEENGWMFFLCFCESFLT